jgi:hypothetical protein
MKFITILAAALLTGTTVQAQQYSAGIRTGAAYLIPKKDNPFLSYSISNKYAWEKEIFIRKESKKHWAFELAFSSTYTAGNTVSNPVSVCGVNEGGPGGPQYGRTKISSYAANLSIQYKIAFVGINAHSMLHRFKSYAGIRLSPSWVSISSNTHYDPALNSKPFNYSQRDQFSTMWGAFTYLLNYEVNKQLNISSLAAFSISDSYFNNSYGWPVEQARGKISLQLGAAYKF